MSWNGAEKLLFLLPVLNSTSCLLNDIFLQHFFFYFEMIWEAFRMCYCWERGTSWHFSVVTQTELVLEFKNRL